MPVKTYNKFEDVLEQLREYIFRIKGAGKSLIPAERELAEQFEASRGTIGKALRQLESEKIIVRNRQGTHILASLQKKRYIYAASVHRNNNTFWFSPYYRLWQELELLMRDNGLRIELYQFDPEDESQSVESQGNELAEADTVFLSLMNETVSTVVEGLRLRNRRVILLDETNSMPGVPTVALDNTAVGELAAQQLLDAGYRHPSVISPLLNLGNPAFLARLKGFDRIMREHGMLYEVFSSNTHDRFTELTHLNKCISLLPEQGFDCAFFLTDEDIDLADSLIERGLVPEKFGILGFDGSMKARTHRPPVDCISHGIEGIARQIIKMILNQETGNDTPVTDCRISPQFCPGKTLRKQA